MEQTPIVIGIHEGEAQKVVEHSPTPIAASMPENNSSSSSTQTFTLEGQLFESGKITVVQGATFCLDLSVQMQMVSRVLLVDAGNVFNPYYIHRNFREITDVKTALENISVSRPFTICQLRQVIEFEAEKQLNSDFRVLIIPCIDDLFYEDGLKVWEAREVFLQTMESLDALAKKQNIFCFISFVGKYFRNLHEGAKLP
ncbi:MAG: hypothetical protein ABH863_01685 [Candidatus Micrarchaeota archaeon]